MNHHQQACIFAQLTILINIGNKNVFYSTIFERAKLKHSLDAALASNLIYIRQYLNRLLRINCLFIFFQIKDQSDQRSAVSPLSFCVNTGWQMQNVGYRCNQLISERSCASQWCVHASERVVQCSLPSHLLGFNGDTRWRRSLTTMSNNTPF